MSIFEPSTVNKSARGKGVKNAGKYFGNIRQLLEMTFTINDDHILKTQLLARIETNDIFW